MQQEDSNSTLASCRIYGTLSTVFNGLHTVHLILTKIHGRALISLIGKMLSLRLRGVRNVPSLPKMTVSRWQNFRFKY